jgi:hypothetical protein
VTATLETVAGGGVDGCVGVEDFELEQAAQKTVRESQAAAWHADVIVFCEDGSDPDRS